jgi:uncharacterized protein (DUF885 family)/ribosome-associated protein YbcJ (S4-like RNA binding protein)
VPGVTLDHLCDDLLDAVFTAEPLGASLLGLPGYDHLLGDLSAEGERRSADRFDEIARRAEALDPTGMSETDLQTLGFVRHVAATQRDVTRLGAVEWTVTDLWIAPASALLELLPRVALDTPERVEGFLQRLADVPAYLGTAASRHRAGVAAGRTPVARLVSAAVAHLDRVLEGDLAGLRVPAAPSGDPDGTFADRRDRMLGDAVRPALEAYRDALVQDVLPAARSDEQAGLCWLPDGKEAYATLARQHTSTSRTPDELHALGLSIVQALAAEYTEIGARLFGTDDLGEIFERLRSDPSLAFRSEEDMLEQARAAIARAEEVAPDWFGSVPEERCQVEAVPAAAAPGAPPAYYLPPAMDGSRRGTYFLNTHEPTQRRRHLAEAVAFHEAVPGHHFQMTTAQGLTGLPLARRILADTAFAEGWGLYCERLADEMGLYSSDLARMGMLAADSWRAARLVVDTGIHAFGWSRQQAIDWTVENTPLSLLEITTEVDRYIAYAGQALSYMVGRQEMTALRRRATERLGDRFDLKAFHDLVLGTGGLPLAVLAEVVDRWEGTAPAAAGAREVRVTGDTIRLAQFLKLADVVETGGEARRLLEQRGVQVNGVTETRRGRQLHRGDVVTVDGQILRAV